ncbi:MAG: RluA family pseudouridine synthase [Lachnospiraceae bacterium]|nr:RluA family pseudouridine synthase [Lachnospiraceae bacterium]
MKQIFITQEESGQRLDKLLSRYMGQAPKSFLYKMLRKKNITLNGKKAEGKEILRPGDLVKLFLSDETWDKFGGIPAEAADSLCVSAKSPVPAFPEVPVLVPGVRPPTIVYQDGQILLFNKPSGMLSQKAGADDVSLMEYLKAYLLSSGALTEEQMRLVRPSICNRLDRNTSGLVAAGVSLVGLQTLNRLFKERSVRKHYRCIVCGSMSGDGCLRGFLKKNTRTNLVTISTSASEDAKPIETAYRVLLSEGELSLLEVHLITGRSHQIRAHLASIGHPVLGDPKYGDPALNRRFAHFHGVHSQLLHAYRLEFPQVDGRLSYLSGRCFSAPEPELFEQLLNG